MCGGDGGSGAHSAAADRLYNIQGDIATQGWDIYKNTYFPLEKETIGDVRALSDPAQVQPIVDRNVQDVAEQFTKIKGERERQMWGLGINPQDGAYDSNASAMRLGQAGASASAANATRMGLKNMQLQAKLGLLNTGRGLANNAGSQVGAAAGGFASLANAERDAAARESAGYGQAAGTIVGAGLSAWGGAAAAGLVAF